MLFMQVTPQNKTGAVVLSTHAQQNIKIFFSTSSCSTHHYSANEKSNAIIFWLQAHIRGFTTVLLQDSDDEQSCFCSKRATDSLATWQEVMEITQQHASRPTQLAWWTVLTAYFWSIVQRNFWSLQATRWKNFLLLCDGFANEQCSDCHCHNFYLVCTYTK